MRYLIPLTLLIGCNPPTQQAIPPVTADGALTATVTRVIDGDTVCIQIDGKEQAIKLDGIDCPETRGDGGQPYDFDAVDHERELCLMLADCFDELPPDVFDRWTVSD